MKIKHALAALSFAAVVTLAGCSDAGDSEGPADPGAEPGASDQGAGQGQEQMPEADLSDVDKKVVAYMDDMQADLGPTPAIIPAGGGTFQQVQQRMVQDLIFDRKDPMAAAQELHDEVQGNLR